MQHAIWSRTDMRSIWLSLVVERQSGVSLIELLVAVTISGIVFSGVCEALAHFGQRFRTQHVVTGIRQEARIGLDVLSSELRLAGTGETPGRPPLLKITPSEVSFRANLSGFQTIVKEPALGGQRDLIVENGTGWPEGKDVNLCSLNGCVTNRLARNGQSSGLTLAFPLAAGIPAGSAVTVSNRVRYYIGRDEAGAPRVMRDVDGGAGTLVSGLQNVRFEYFNKAGIPTGDPALVARVRVTASLQMAGGVVVKDTSMRQ